MKIQMMGRLPNDDKAPARSAGEQPCDECMEHMEQGFLLIERSGDSVTGRRWVVDPKYIVEPERQRRVGYVTPSDAKTMGLYRTDSKTTKG